MSTVRGAILDVDGTLVDSNDQHAHAWVDALREFGYDVELEHVRRLIGMGGDKLLPTLTGVSAESDEGKRMSARRSEIFKERYFREVRPFPKSRELLERMRDARLTLAVASSAKPDELAPLLERAGATDLVASETSSEDAEHSKPDPDIVQAAVDRSGLEPNEVVMLGDTPYDVEASLRAGIRAVALRCGGWEDGDLDGASAIYDDPEDLLANFETSPFVRPPE